MEEMEKKKMRKVFIQGVFFAKSPETNNRYLREDDTNPDSDEKIHSYIFSGLLEVDENGEGKGVLYDNFGISKIINVQLQEAGYLYFQKRYLDKGAIILTRIKRKGGENEDIWEGDSLDKMGKKTALRCFLKEVPETFFQAEELMKVFSEKINC